ncbi:putative disease resistance protein (TIR-NBS-LRR class) [Melia azedarach]|uniref:Disease resistance protein (TIR-NBS-LRR class) n=1 Tax=Melia azedarach TaxID=155640 RepID=A0ACC1YJX7_MELAZ|nr:putative disease resistance protein (TIR-NBS-LRR class) [Melia azedarach]
MASFSPSSFSCKYDVFLSFRGEDTRENFTSHLFAALSRKKINTFVDEGIHKGERISADLLNAIIEGSKISVIILSKNYADSKWCLDELVKILNCKKMHGQIVIPVFYYVHPSDVRKQTASFGDAFARRKKEFKKMPDNVIKWRTAMTEASYLSGYESTRIRPEAKLVDVIVMDVLNKLKDITVSTDSNGLVGINWRIEQVKSLLCMGCSDFRIVGMWGMGGIGKTTIAEALFKQIAKEFEGTCFMANVREESEKGVGLLNLHKQVVSQLLQEQIEIGGPNIPQYTEDRLRHMKVFIVLDDVNKFGQLERLAGGIDRFGPGSRIIVTTRDRQVLDQYGVDQIYEVMGMNDNEAHEHFYNFAFRQNHCPQEFKELSQRVVDYANGNPLALKVLGSFLYPKSKFGWETSLHNLWQISGSEIYDVLKISYDELEWKVKNIFLDIACFFKGNDEDNVISIFDDYYSIHYGLDVLAEKSLITRSNKKLEMHDLLQEMGRKIVCEECPEEPGKRSRLWHHDDICHILEKNKGSNSIKGIFLNLSKIRDIHLDSNVFTNMYNLQYLKFYMPVQFDGSYMSSKMHLPQGLDCLHDELRYLHWHGYSYGILPRNFIPKNLIELSLCYSKIEQLWEGKKEAPKLKFIDLQHSDYLRSISDSLEAPNLERIILSYCKKLCRLPSAVQNSDTLGLLCLRGCTSFSCFPQNIHFRSPINIDFSGCVNLTEFPSISGNVIKLQLCHTAIEEVPSSISRLTSLKELILSDCKSLKSLSTDICKLKSLYWLQLTSCSNFERFPEILEEMESLECLNLEGTKIRELPSSIERLTVLKRLNYRYCRELGSLPTNLGKLKSLKFIEGEYSAISQMPPSIKDLNGLEEADFHGSRGLVLPPSLSGLSSFRFLTLSDCDIREIPQDIGCLSSLEILDLSGNDFESLPTSIRQLPELNILYLRDCNMLESLPEMPPSLGYLDARNCKRLQSLPELPECREILDASLLETLNKSLLEALNQRSVTIFKRGMMRGPRIWRKEYVFCGCTRLEEKAGNILADSQALLKLFYFYEKVSNGFFIYLPGSRIPGWFSDRCSGSSIIIQLPEHCCKRNLTGFALCAVIGFEEDSDVIRGQPVRVICSYCYGDNSDTLRYNIFVDSDQNQVILGFEPYKNIFRRRDGDNYTAVSFDFSVYYDQELDVKSPKVKCCGVCPVYAHLNDFPPNTFTVNMEPPTEEELTQYHNKAGMSTGTSGSIVDGSEDEEVELTPNRICKEQKSSFSSQFFQRRSVGLCFFLMMFVFLLFIIWSPIPLWKLALI